MKMNGMVGCAAVAILALGAAANASVVVTSDGTFTLGANTVTYPGSATVTGQTSPNAAEGAANGAAAGGTQAVVGGGTTFTVPAGGSVSLTNFQLGLSAISSGGAGSQTYQLNLYALTSDPNTFPLATTGSNLLGQSLASVPSSGANSVLYGFALSGADAPTLAPGAYVLGISTTGAGGFIARGPDGVYAGGTVVNNGGQTGAAANREAVFSLTFAPVPEPASLGLLGIGAIGLLTRRRQA
jgi:hypothetical protein